MKLVDWKEESQKQAAYCYPGNYQCSCGWMLCPKVVDRMADPIELRLQCGNQSCKNFGKLFKFGDEAKIPLHEVKA